MYQLLSDAGINQRQIAERTGQAQSEVPEIRNGRRVMAYEVLVHSVRARERLTPLATALATRPGHDYRNLAQLARKVVAGQPH